MAFGRLGALGGGFGRIGAGNAGLVASGGGAGLLAGEANGFAADFTHAVDGERVAVKTAGTAVLSGTSFVTSSGSSSKWVYNAAGVLANVAAGTLPLDYDPVTHAARGLLVEPAATNLVVYSKDFLTSWNVGGGATKTPAQGTAPNGANELVKFTMVAGTAAHYIFISTTGPAHSVYAKAGTLNWIAISSAAPNTDGVYFNLSTGTVGTQKGTSTGYMEDCGGGIWRCVAVVPSAAFVTISFHSADNQIATWTAAGGETSFLWQAQSETGTVATSPIFTTSATVTRAVDQYNVTPASIGHNATAGSWWAEWSARAVVANGRIVGNTSASAPLLMGTNSVGMLDGTTLSKSLTWAVNTTHKAISAYASGDRAVTMNGAAVATDAGATTNLLAPGAAIFIGNGGSTPMNGYIRKIRYLPRRPTGAEMATMST